MIQYLSKTMDKVMDVQGYQGKGDTDEGNNHFL